MALQQYITSADITATVLKDFSISGYINRTNDHIEALGVSVDCLPEDIVTPISPLLKEYAVNYCNMIIVLDKIGANNVELSQDKYVVLHSVYNKEVERLRQYINYDVMTDEVDGADETSRTAIIYRS